MTFSLIAHDPKTGQFGIADNRTPQAVASSLVENGLDPVWKDWEPAILNP